MKLVLPALLSLNAGYVDTAGFLALHGLFTTHVTGNFVTLGAALAFGTSGVLAKLLALPVFCAVVLAARLSGAGFERLGWPALRILMTLQVVWLAAAAAIAIRLGPFPDGDTTPALLAGGALVAAMAIQNAAHRTYLTSLPATTVMTLTTTQVMVDLADLIRGVGAEARAAAKTRLGPMTLGVACFALGCGASAFAYTYLREWCFAAPPVLALGALLADAVRTDPAA